MGRSPFAINRQHAQTLWAATGGPKPALSSFADGSSYEVAIVGAGFTGLTAALHLARAGKSVIVLEGEQIGSGASGANAGFVVPNFAKAEPSRVVELLGERAGRRLLDCVGAGADRVFSIIRENGIAADAEQVGWMHIAHSPATVPLLRKRAEDWAKLGRPVRFLDVGEARALTGARLCHGALFDASGGMLHPTKYAYGLASAALRAGVTICEQAPVDEVARHGSEWRLTAGSKQIAAKSVLLCTNAFTEGVADRLGRQTIPLSVFQLATEPLSKGAAARIAPTRVPAADTRSNLFTYRLDAANRLITGGMSMFPPGAGPRISRMVAARLAKELRAALPPVSFVWRGRAAMTPDFIPHLYEFGPSFWGGIGCNGRGIAMTSMLGEVLAEAVLRGRADDLPVPLVKERSGLPLQRLSGVVASIAVAQARFRDWREGL